MVHRSEPVAMASPFRAVISGGQRSAPSLRRNGLPSSPKPSNGFRIRSATDAPARLATPADAAQVAQARIFEAILRAEIAELLNLVKSMTPRWTGGSTGGNGLPEALQELYARIEEVDSLLNALWTRFPYVPRVGSSERGLNFPGLPPATDSRQAIQDHRRHNSRDRQIEFPQKAGRHTVP